MDQHRISLETERGCVTQRKVRQEPSKFGSIRLKPRRGRDKVSATRNFATEISFASFFVNHLIPLARSPSHLRGPPPTPHLTLFYLRSFWNIIPVVIAQSHSSLFYCWKDKVGVFVVVSGLISLTSLSLRQVSQTPETLKRTCRLSCRRQDSLCDEFRFFFDTDRGLFTGCSLRQRSPSSPPWAALGCRHIVSKKLAPYPLRPAVRLRYIPSSACTSTSPQRCRPLRPSSGSSVRLQPREFPQPHPEPQIRYPETHPRRQLWSVAPVRVRQFATHFTSRKPATLTDAKLWLFAHKIIPCVAYLYLLSACTKYPACPRTA